MPGEERKFQEQIKTPGQGSYLRYFGDYELLERVACGGMGVVFRARQISLNRIVAVKIMAGAGIASTQFVQRFRTEAEAAASLEHPNIVPVYEIGQYESQQYFSMRFIEGGSLASRMPEFQLPSPAVNQQPTPVRGKTSSFSRQVLIARLLKTIALAVHYAHQRGVLHRDLKPGNILIDRSGEPHVTDFGLAKLLTQDNGMTQSLAVLGTPSYMAPEQASGQTKHLTIAADVYGLGTILYELLAGKPPFKGATTAETVRLVAETEPVPPRTINRTVNPDLETICLKCLEKTPERRYPSAFALFEDLDRWLKNEPIAARPVNRLERVWRWCQREPRLAVLATTVFVLMLVVSVGSPVAVWRINSINEAETRQRQRAEAAENATLEKLRDALLAQAHANRVSGEVGRRFESLVALGKAAEIRPSVPLRNEAIACMALMDVKLLKLWQFEWKQQRAAFDPEAERYALSDHNGNVTVFLVRDGEVRALVQAPPHFRGPAICSFSRHGKFLSRTDSRGISYIYDLERKKEVMKVEGDWPKFVGDGELFAAASLTGGIFLYDLGTGKLRKHFAEGRICAQFYFDAHVESLALIDADRREVHVIRTLDDNPVRSLVHGDEVRAAQWHSDGKHLAVCDRKQVTVWRVETGTPEGTFPVVEGTISVAFAPSGRVLATCGWDGKARFWNWRTREKLFEFPAATYLHFNSRGDRLAFEGGSGESLRLYKVAGGSEVLRVTEPTDGSQGGERIYFNHDGSVFAYTYHGDIKICEASAGTEIGAVRGENIAYLFPDPAGNGFYGSAPKHLLKILLAGSHETGFRITGIEKCGPEDHLLWTGVSTDGKQFLAKNLRLDRGEIYRGENFAEKIELKSSSGDRRFSAISPSGKWVASGYWHEAQVRVWDATTGVQVHWVPTKDMSSVVFSPDSRWLVIGGYDFNFLETSSWNWHLGLRRPLEGFPPAMTFSRDGGIFAHAHSQTSVQLNELPSGHELTTFEIGFRVRELSFNADASKLAVSGEGTPEYQIWNLRLIRQHLARLGLDWETPE